MLVRAYDLITGDEDARVCKDIPDAACNEQPGNFFRHLLSYTSTKIGDSLASAKLVLPWLLSWLGAPGFMAGLTVPIRESGSLVPQLFVAGFIRPYAVRKGFWVIGSVLQGLAVLAMAGVAYALDGATAGWAVIGLLVIFSLSRGISSVASKDVLGKTISKARRGALMGYAGMVASLVALGFGVYAKALKGDGEVGSFFMIILPLAGILWLFAAGVYATLKEQPGATEGGGNAATRAFESISLLKTDRQFRHFVITRALLLSTALSQPFYVVLARETTNSSLGSFGLLIIAGGIGGSVSSAVWGRLADISSRRVMIAAAVITAVLGGLVFALVRLDGIFTSQYSFAAYFLIMGIAHGGARLGRKTYLIDMATPEKRPAYVALSNTAIGILLLVGGGIGALAQLLGTDVAILVLAIVAVIAAASAVKLPEA